MYFINNKYDRQIDVHTIIASRKETPNVEYQKGCYLGSCLCNGVMCKRKSKKSAPTSCRYENETRIYKLGGAEV